jgi:radical SAM protein with 4Fe4S-binding SPASM domain
MAEERKRCSWIHDTLCIHPRGDVYACCHLQPGPIGNIYEDSLAEIYNSERVREFRQQEIDGTLRCVKHCTLPHVEVASDSVYRDYHKDVRQLQFEFSEKCNIACIMCTQDHQNRLELDADVLVRNIEIPKSQPRTHLFGGEPLVIKSAKRFFAHCIEQGGTKVSFLTNGTAINDEMAKKIALHCDVISFSLNAATRETHEIVNAGSRFDKVIRNINRVIEAKRTLPGKVNICGHMTIVVENLEELPLFVEKRLEFEFEYINFGFDRKVPPLLAADPDRKARLAGALADTLSRHGGSKVDTRRLKLLFGDAADVQPAGAR